MPPLLTTDRASEKLTELGVKRSPATLRKLRCLGGGPSYRIFNGRPYYTEEDLVAWIQEGLSAPRHSSSVAAKSAAPDRLYGRSAAGRSKEYAQEPTGPDETEAATALTREPGS
jgi:hypothetical protein